MKATITKTLIAVVAGLAIVADAFLLFVKPHLARQATADGSALASSGSGASDSTSSNGAESSQDSSSSGTSSSSSAGELTDGTYTSVASPNEYGEIQLQVTVEGGKITKITTIKAPTHGRSQSVNAQAIPALTERAISAQSSDIQFVSGATETSTAFVNSLQDAINQSLNASK
ncbi:FMN-binding domain-containing protein [Bifidobacterium goeldii]|uniref:FMN-binding domain-containing protein n=1 Tax=Bifidobacterium goeldii TaxID=2306975 RepID=A0A430FL76_9BIFI|nr:FMN-binding protein [Bifidobacterium goeldii]RSX53653.1 FMN-binding domain-containing protein [Bifidobacterium goeldii]